MKGLIRNGAVLLSFAASAAGVGCGTFPAAPTAQEMTCCSNKDLYDRCYPQRYNNLATREVNAAFTPQVQNGHVLDQTVWNHYFEVGTDRLTPGGQDALATIARRRPCPDTTIYLATATTGLAGTLLPGADLRQTLTLAGVVVMVLGIVAILEMPKARGR